VGLTETAGVVVREVVAGSPAGSVIVFLRDGQSGRTGYMEIPLS
jgi:hypothetical protein